MPMRILRQVRFSLNDDNTDPAGPRNSWAGWPRSSGLSPYLTVWIEASGPIDADTGFVCNIKDIDRLVRTTVVDRFRSAHRDSTRGLRLAETMVAQADDLFSIRPNAPPVESITLNVTPHLAYRVQRGAPRMVSVTYAFEFSAAHRLYTEKLSPAENERAFGRCANPNGHGHNYVLQVTLGGEPNPTTGQVIPLIEFERTVNETVIDRYDHKHLNLDLPEFADLNPTVENITQVIFDRLKPAFDPITLECVRVYETPKTYAELRHSE